MKTQNTQLPVYLLSESKTTTNILILVDTFIHTLIVLLLVIGFKCHQGQQADLLPVLP